MSLDDERPLYTCFVVEKIPTHVNLTAVPCLLCKNNILLGTIFSCCIIDRIICEELLIKWNVDERDICSRYKFHICIYCFLPKVELFYTPGESEEQQVKNIERDMLSCRHCIYPPFKERLTVNKSKSARK